MNRSQLAVRLCSLVCVFCAVTVRNTEGAENEKVYLLFLAPFPNPVASLNPLYEGGYDLLPGAQLAVEHINADPNVLPNRTVELIVGSSGCDKTTVTVTSVLKHVVESNVRVMGIVGPACSESALSLATLTSESRLGVIQVMSGTSPLLNDHQAYTYTFGVASSSLIYVDIIMELIQRNNWDRFAILYDSNREYFIRTHLELLNRTANENITFVGGMFNEYIPLEELKLAMDTRVVIVLSSNGLARKMLCVANDLSFYYPVYQFVFIDRSVSSMIGTSDFTFTYDDRTLKCTMDGIRRALNNSVLLRYGLDSLPPNRTTVSGYTVEEIHNLYRQKLDESAARLNMTLQPDIYAYSYYDKTWTIAKALDIALPEIENILPDRLFVGGPHTEIIREAMYKLDFQGASVSVKFDRRNGHVSSNVDIFLADQENQVTIGQWSNGSIEFISYDTLEFVESVFEKRFVRIHQVLAVFSLLLTLLVLVATLGLQIVNIVYNKHRAIKADSPRLNHFIFTGCYCLLLAVVLYTSITAFPSESLDQSARLVGTIFCNAMVFATILGYTLIAGTICAKSWRLYRIFSHAFETNNFLSDKPLAVIVIVLAMVDFLILIPWMLVGPIKEMDERDIIVEGSEIPFERVQYFCEAKGNYVAFPLVLIIYQALLTGVVLALSISNRNIKQKEFRSTTRINTLVYILVVECVLGGSLYVILSVLVDDASLDLQYIFFVFTLLCAVLLVLGFLFVPQVYNLMNSRSHNVRQFSSIILTKRTSVREALYNPRKASFLS